ncbi:MAG: RICIN domain-containing protein [Lewinella sp.]
MRIFPILTLLLALFTSFSAEAQVRTGQVYHLRSSLDVHYYLSAVDQKTTRKNYITTNKTTPTDQASRWTLEDAGGGYYYFKNGGGFYLDVAQGSKEAGARLWLFNRNPSDAQKFRVKPSGDGAYYIHPKTNEGLAIDVYKSNAARNSVVWCTQANRGMAQKWKFIPTTSGNSGNTPSPRPAASQVLIPKAQMTALGNLVLSTLQVTLNNFGSRYRDSQGRINWYKAESSKIQFMGQTSSFTIPEYVHGLRDKMHFVNDIRSKNFSANFEANRFIIHATFEEDGAEIKGMCSNCAKFREDNGALDFNFQNNRWKVYLRLVPYGDSFTFEVDEVKFHGQVDGKVFGELFDGLVQRQLEPTVRQALREQMNGQKAAIASAIKQGANAAGYRWNSVRSVRVSGSSVVITQ